MGAPNADAEVVDVAIVARPVSLVTNKSLIQQRGGKLPACHFRTKRSASSKQEAYATTFV